MPLHHHTSAHGDVPVCWRGATTRHCSFEVGPWKASSDQIYYEDAVFYLVLSQNRARSAFFGDGLKSTVSVSVAAMPATRGRAVCLCVAAVLHATVNAYIPVVHLGARGVFTAQRCPRRGGVGGRAVSVPLLRANQKLAACRESHARARRLRGPGLQMAIDAGERVQKILPLYDGE